ncbi:hypothetical protein DXJ58_08490 [Vibrio fluvialis]|nr:hypothetical protein [Vibrio fluvialis]EKO4000253.1 hypothetical protein [Vibrio fluvialis]
MENWIPALSTTVVTAVLVFLCRNWLITRLTNSVKHEYDSKLAKIKSDLERKQLEIESIRSGTLANLSERQKILYTRQLQAIEGIWYAVLALAPAKGISATLSNIPYDEVSTLAEKDQKVREMFDMISPVDLSDLPQSQALKERPFISPLVWAYFSAYESIVMHAAIRMQLLKKGIKLDSVIDHVHVTKLIKTALPHQNEYIDKYGAAGFHYLLDELEQSLLASFKLMLDGAEADNETLKKAAQITRQAEELSNASDIKAIQGV